LALSGLGGDEIFAGYSTFKTVPKMERFYRAWQRAPGFAREFAGAACELMYGRHDQAKKLFALFTENGALLHPYFLSRMLFTHNDRVRLFPGVEPEAQERADAPLRDNIQRAKSLDAVNRVSYLESRCYMLNTLLRDADVMSMAHGLELRVPFADYRLARSVLSFPGTGKLGNGVPKPLLVHALGNVLPKRIVRRPKRGFTLPFERWLKGKWKASAADTLQKVKHGPLSGIIDGEAADCVWGDFLTGKTSWSRPWSLFVLQQWCDVNLS
jgi:asparagine synthase (glutamine-hydrolysing)